MKDMEKDSEVREWGKKNNNQKNEAVTTEKRMRNKEKRREGPQDGQEETFDKANKEARMKNVEKHLQL